MYHDQGLIPVKTLDFHGGVNITLGLPFIRTSPDHGTAFGIAGKGIARADSLIAAIRTARKTLLLRGAERLTAIEMDDRFIPALAEIGDLSEGRMEIAQGDALKYDIAANLPAPRKIVANLPYNVGTKMLINWVSASPLFWSQMVLMFQLEVAQRVVARPGEPHYGRLAILCQSVADCRLAFEVPARAFTPPPKVDSAVIVLDPLEAPFADLKLLGRVTQAAFGQRRKMLRRSLRSLAEQSNIDLETWLTGCDIDPKARPETLAVSAFQALTKALKAHL